jgi:hypothetical protein
VLRRLRQSRTLHTLTFGPIFRGPLHRTHLQNDGYEIGSADFARAIAEALRKDFGETHASVKTVVALTKANERAVKNWFSAKNGPTGRHLIDLVRSSDDVLETVLRLSGTSDLIASSGHISDGALIELGGQEGFTKLANRC